MRRGPEETERKKRQKEKQTKEKQTCREEKPCLRHRLWEGVQDVALVQALLLGQLPAEDLANSLVGEPALGWVD